MHEILYESISMQNQNLPFLLTYEFCFLVCFLFLFTNITQGSCQAISFVCIFNKDLVLSILFFLKIVSRTKTMENIIEH